MKKKYSLLFALSTLVIPPVFAFADGLVINSNSSSSGNCLCVVQGFAGQFNKSFEVVGTKNISFSDLPKGSENNEGLKFTCYSIKDRSCSTDNLCTPSDNELGFVGFSIDDNNMAKINDFSTSSNFTVNPQDAKETTSTITITCTP